MTQYKSKYNEQLEDSEVAEIVRMLRDENFGNDAQRRKFVKLIINLFHINSKEARLFFKRLGNYCTELGEELLEEPRRVIDDEKI
jgi:hypothetical protein